MTALDAAFIARARQTPYDFTFRDATYSLRATQATRYVSGMAMPAELELVDSSGEVLGYITPYDEREHGAVKAHLFDVGMPTIFGTVEDAVREILA